MANQRNKTGVSDLNKQIMARGANSPTNVFGDSFGGGGMFSSMARRAQRDLQTGLNYEQKLNDMYRAQLKDYEKNTLPIIDQLEDETTDTSIVDNSRRLSSQLEEKTAGISERQLGYSMGDTLASRRAAMANNQNHAVAKSRNTVMTQAHTDQRNKQQAARTELMGIAEQLQQSGTASLSQAYAAKNRREQAYRAAKGGFMSQVGAIAGGAIGFFAGGPMGAAAGAGIGGSVGGAIGG